MNGIFRGKGDWRKTMNFEGGFPFGAGLSSVQQSGFPDILEATA